MLELTLNDGGDCKSFAINSRRIRSGLLNEEVSIVNKLIISNM